MPLSGERPRVVILNDTSRRSHHGCSRVMRLLKNGLTEAGLQITATCPAHSEWARDEIFVAALSGADFIVINGEGTLHHGRPAGERLLSVLDHPLRGNTPVAVVNALWQANPPEWTARLARCSLVSARDDKSYAAMISGGISARLVPDLSLTDGAVAVPGERRGLIVGDSVRYGARRALALAAKRLKADALLPTKTRQSAVWHNWPSNQILSALYHGAAPCRLPPLKLAADEDAYLRLLGQAAMHLTGRFHAVCLSIITTTPVLAVGSNSWKIEALLGDAGLAADRLLPVEALADLGPDALVRPYSDAEKAGIARFLTDAQAKARSLFADLAQIAKRGGP